MSAAAGPRERSARARFPGRPEILLVLALTLVSAVVYLAAGDSGPLQTIEGETLDWRFRLRGPQTPGPEVAVVAVDDRTLAELGRWPISRSWLARAVDALAADGARVIVFDLLLVGSDSGGEGPDEADRALAEAIARAGKVVVPFAFVFDPEEANLSRLPQAIEASAYRVVRSQAGRVSELTLHPAGVLAPLDAFLAAGQPAHVTMFVAADGSARYAYPVIRYGDAFYPSLAIEAARLFLGIEKDKLALDLGRSLSLGARSFATDRNAALPIDYAGPAGSFKAWSLAEIAKGTFPAGSFRERIVLIGAKAAGLGDRFDGPYGTGLSGVEVFANQIDNLLGRGFLKKSSLTEALDLLAIALAGLLVALHGALHRPALMLVATAALVAAWSAVNLYAFTAFQLWLNFTFPTFVILLGATLVLAGRAVRENRLRGLAEQQERTLTRYVSPLTAADLESRGRREAGDPNRTVAVMFVDLVGFTHASESMTPAETAEHLRRFHRLVEEAAERHGGVIGQFIGDGALLVFGLAGAEPADAANALACARDIAGAVADWGSELAQGGGRGVRCGIGLHLGPVTVAEVGGSRHAQITVTGDTVNVASRLEALTRQLSTTVIASDAAVEAARGAGARAALEGFAVLPVQQIRGRDNPVGVWAWPAPSSSGGSRS